MVHPNARAGLEAYWQRLRDKTPKIYQWDLEYLYIEKGESLRTIGERFGVSRTHIYLLMKKYGIPRRASSNYTVKKKAERLLREAEEREQNREKND